MSRLPAAERKEQLLETAVALFAERGFSGTTTATLAKEAGVTEPIIYRHFPSKKDLFISVIERAGRQTIELWVRELETARDPAQRLRRLIGVNPMTWQKGRGMYRVIVQGLTEIDDEEIREALREHVQRLHGFVAGEVALAQSNGQVSKAFSPEITAWLLLHLGIGYGMLEALGMPRHAVDNHNVHVRQVVTKMMLGDRAKRVQDEMLRRQQRQPAGPNEQSSNPHNADGADE